MIRVSRMVFCAAALLTLIAAGAPEFSTVTGTWKLSQSGYAHRWQLQLSSDADLHTMQWNETLSLNTVPSSASFTIAREAGTFRFTGTLAAAGGSGRFTFTPSDAFVSGLRARNLQVRRGHDIMSAAAIDLTLAYIDSIGAAGYPNLRFDDLLAFRAVGATPKSIAALRTVFGDIPPAEVISTSALHVTPAYVAELRSMGIAPVTPERAVTFKALHIDKAYIADLARMGYSHMDPQDVISFKAMHIDAGYLQHLREHGLKNLTPQQIIQMKAAGL